MTKLFALILIFSVCLVYTQERIAVIQDSQVRLLNSQTGEIIDPSFITLDSGTPKALIQVEDEIWITYQLADKIERYDLDGNLMFSIDTGLDNIRGLAVVNGSEVWVCNAGDNNGAPGNGIIRFDLNGNNLGSFLVTPQSDSPFDIIDNGNGEVYISYIASNNIDRRDYNGAFLGNIVEPDVLSFIEQIEIEQPGVILAAVFSSVNGGNQNGLYRISETDGSVIDYWSVGALRGVVKLGSGEILYSSGAGVSRLDPNTGVSVLIDDASAQFFGRLNLTLGVSDFSDANFTYYPNPTKDLLILKHSENISEIYISNLLGQKILHLQLQTPKVELDLSPLAKGIYLVTVKINENEKTVKIMKE